MSSQQHRYSLGNEASELERLDQQAAAMGRASELLLRSAGVSPGMHALDLGTGLGHVALMVGEMVGSTGSVTGIDRSSAPLDIAHDRAASQGAANVRFLEADAATYEHDRPYDLLVERLLLMHLPDPVAALRHHVEQMGDGALAAAIEFDIGGARSEPSVPLVDRCVRWVMDTFTSVGAHPTIGTRLHEVFRAAGLYDVRSFGIQGYYAPDDPTGPRLVAGIVRSLAHEIVAAGLTTEEEIGVETLEARLAADVREAGAVIVPPTVVGAWGIRSVE
jgi:SAM-dependent methyltransferase